MTHLFDITDHKKKIIVITAGILVFIWDFLIVPIAASKGLILPAITIEHLRTVGTLLLTL